MVRSLWACHIESNIFIAFLDELGNFKPFETYFFLVIFGPPHMPQGMPQGMSHRVKCFLLHFSTNWAILSLLRHTFFCDFLFLSFAQLCFVSEWLPTRILNGVYSLFSANYCSNPFEILFCPFSKQSQKKSSETSPPIKTSYGSE